MNQPRRRNGQFGRTYRSDYGEIGLGAKESARQIREAVKEFPNFPKVSVRTVYDEGREGIVITIKGMPDSRTMTPSGEDSEEMQSIKQQLRNLVKGDFYVDISFETDLDRQE